MLVWIMMYVSQGKEDIICLSEAPCQTGRQSCMFPLPEKVLDSTDPVFMHSTCCSSTKIMSMSCSLVLLDIIYDSEYSLRCSRDVS